MKTYRIKRNVTAYACKPDTKNPDWDFIRLAYKKGCTLVSQQAANIVTEEDSPPMDFYVQHSNSVALVAGPNDYLIIPDSTLRDITRADAQGISEELFNELFEPVEDENGENGLDGINGESCKSITDDEYRDGAIRANLFMESGATSATTPVKAKNESGDRGGLTKYGITEKSYPNLDIKNLTYNQAFDIYKTDYWNACHADKLPRPLSALTFDLCVTSGPRNAINNLQRTVGTIVDGIFGPKTQAAAESACSTMPKMLAACRLFTEKRIAYYQAIVKNDSTQSKFLNGWINRAVRSMNFAQALLTTLDIL